LLTKFDRQISPKRIGNLYLWGKIKIVQDTLQQFDQAIAKCKHIFIQKTTDYGTAWRILRSRSLTDQLYIKAKRIRNIEELQHQKIDDSVETEYIGIINYAIMALIQLEATADLPLEMNPSTVETLYDEQVSVTRQLLDQKNHDYGEAWRDMRISSYTDLILMKLLRVKQIEDNQGKTLISEGLDANYRDIINYAIFALIKIEENRLQLKSEEA
jgi:hypothetical protein